MLNLGNAPIILFTYNRPWHSRQTVVALLKNPEAADSNLIIFSDGSRDDIAREKVDKVRQILRTILGFKSIRICLCKELCSRRKEREPKKNSCEGNVGQDGNPLTNSGDSNLTSPLYGLQ